MSGNTEELMMQIEFANACFGSLIRAKGFYLIFGLSEYI